MTTSGGFVRMAATSDAVQLLRLWSLLFEEDACASGTTWKRHAHEWFMAVVKASDTARVAVVELDGEVIATALGTLEVSVPNPQCSRGRSVRLANVFTLPQHRGLGYGTLLVHDIVDWARSIDADRVDLSATQAGQRLYDRIGFQATKAPRMKLVLAPI